MVSLLALFDFILTWLQHLWSVTSSSRLLEAEEEMLKDAHILKYQASLVGKPGFRLRTLQMDGPQNALEPPIVLLHGFGLGLAFWGRQLAEFQHHHHRVIAIDLPGMGNSEHMPISVNTPEEAEEYFVSSIEEWREAMQLPTMILVGHGLGAYLASIYALKHHTRVARLVTVSAAGMEGRNVENEVMCLLPVLELCFSSSPTLSHSSTPTGGPRRTSTGGLGRWQLWWRGGEGPQWQGQVRHEEVRGWVACISMMDWARSLLV